MYNENHIRSWEQQIANAKSQLERLKVRKQNVKNQSERRQVDYEISRKKAEIERYKVSLQDAKRTAKDMAARAKQIEQEKAERDKELRKIEKKREQERAESRKEREKAKRELDREHRKEAIYHSSSSESGGSSSSSSCIGKIIEYMIGIGLLLFLAIGYFSKNEKNTSTVEPQKETIQTNKDVKPELNLEKDDIYEIDDIGDDSDHPNGDWEECIEDSTTNDIDIETILNIDVEEDLIEETSSFEEDI